MARFLFAFFLSNAVPTSCILSFFVVFLLLFNIASLSVIFFWTRELGVEDLRALLV